MAENHLHFDPYCGISGDMTLGALVDLGALLEEISRRLASLPIGPFELKAERIKRQGIMGTQVHVIVEEDEKPHRHLRHVNEIIEAADLPPRVIERAKRAYYKLAEAEAHVHGSTPEKIHFHEVGAKDAILDVAASMLAVELLGIETFSAEPLTVGFGTVQCQHGTMPVPAPATAELLKGMPTRRGEIESEMVTPTGAAILATLLEGEGSLGFEGEELRGVRLGYGAGSKVFEGHANYLRVQLCEAVEGARRAATLPVHRHAVTALECEIDDMSPETAGYLMERLFEAGALDVHFTPVQMKKNRPGVALRVLCEPEAETPLAERVFRETSTFGLRRRVMERWCLPRRRETVETDLGQVEIKIGFWNDAPLKASPEYESCRKLALELGVPLERVYRTAQRAIDDRKAPEWLDG